MKMESRNTLKQKKFNLWNKIKWSSYSSNYIPNADFFFFKGYFEEFPISYFSCVEIKELHNYSNLGLKIFS